jgi:dinuclear metal center YbgI/SA1388 family protein
MVQSPIQAAGLKSRRIGDLLQRLGSLFPLGTAEDWDNVGLLLGDASQEATGAVVSIDLTHEAVQLAQAKGFSLIINHHPCIFPKGQGVSKILAGSPVYEALRHGISVAAYHTNFDQCSLEALEKVASGLGAQAKGRLFENRSQPLQKLVTFVPESHLEIVRQALFQAGAGHVGRYDACAYSCEGEGTFRGGEGTHPFIGKSGVLEKVQEHRLETVFPAGVQVAVLQALRQAHPYEEVAYDVIPLKQKASHQGLVSGLGYGFWGDFPSSVPFEEFVERVKSVFQIPSFRVTQPTPKEVKRIGFVGGKGSSFLGAASERGCDVFLTGEAGYHAAIGGARSGMSVIELGHRESERFFTETISNWILGEGLGVATVVTPTQALI